MIASADRYQPSDKAKPRRRNRNRKPKSEEESRKRKRSPSSTSDDDEEDDESLCLSRVTSCRSYNSDISSNSSSPNSSSSSTPNPQPDSGSDDSSSPNKRQRMTTINSPELDAAQGTNVEYQRLESSQVPNEVDILSQAQPVTHPALVHAPDSAESFSSDVSTTTASSSTFSESYDSCVVRPQQAEADEQKETHFDSVAHSHAHVHSPVVSSMFALQSPAYLGGHTTIHHMEPLELGLSATSAALVSASSSSLLTPCENHIKFEWNISSAS